jgi:hypothetical protein
MIKTWAQVVSEGRIPEYLFWVGCSGSYDPRAQKISIALVRLSMRESTLPFSAMKKPAPGIRPDVREMNFYFKCSRIRISRHSMATA